MCRKYDYTLVDIIIIRYILVIPCAPMVRLIYTPSALGPVALGLRVYVYIRQITRAHGITIKKTECFSYKSGRAMQVAKLLKQNWLIVL